MGCCCQTGTLELDSFRGASVLLIWISMLKFFLSRLTEQLPPAHYRKADFFSFFTSLFLDESDETSNTMNILWQTFKQWQMTV